MPPIAIFAYNRPNHLKLALEAVERSEKHMGSTFPIYIFCDAPKKQEHAEAVERTREVAAAFTGAKVICRPHNYGFRNITEGISELTDTFGEVIVVEDDVVVAPDFLRFMVEGLRRYASNPQVFMVSGFMYFGSQPQKPETFFLPSSFIWGWATWKRAWEHFTYEPKGVEAFLQNREERYRFDYFGALPFSKMLEKTIKGQWVTWDTQWMFTLFQQKGLALYPHRSLVWNSGVGGGTHGHAGSIDQDPLLGEREYYIHGNLSIRDFQHPRLKWPLQFPDRVQADEKAMRLLACTFLQERLRKKWRLKLAWRWLSLWFQSLFTKRPGL